MRFRRLVWIQVLLHESCPFDFLNRMEMGININKQDGIDIYDLRSTDTDTATGIRHGETREHSKF